jgi:hypothetical protein
MSGFGTYTKLPEEEIYEGNLKHFDLALKKLFHQISFQALVSQA